MPFGLSNAPSLVVPPVSPTPPPAPSPVIPPPPDVQQRAHPMRTSSHNNIHKPKRFFAATKHPLPLDVVPSTVKQALESPHWLSAMNKEFTALQSFGTWELTPAPPNVNIIDCKWVFRMKRKPDGSVDKYKARLVAKGFYQRPEVDFRWTFSPVVKPTTIRTGLSLALHFNWPLRQLDVSNIFRHGTLDVPVSMYQPPGLRTKNLHLMFAFFAVLFTVFVKPLGHGTLHSARPSLPSTLFSQSLTLPYFCSYAAAHVCMFWLM